MLLPTRRTWVTGVGWCVAVVGFIAAVALSRITVTPEGGGQPVAGWPGVALALAALGLLLAAAPAADWLAGIASNERPISPDLSAAAVPGPRAAARSGYGTVSRGLAIVTLVAAASAPLLAGLFWVKDGVQGPVGSVTSPLLPAFVSASSTSGQRYRTLILRPNGSTLDYTVVRQGDPTLGEPELTTDSAAEQALSRQVAALGAPDGADAGDPGLVLGSFGIRWVLLPGPVDPALAERLDGSLGLDVLTSSAGYDLWQVAGPVARVVVTAPDGTVTPLSANPVSMSDASAPAAGGTLTLAEPYGGWTATLNGRALSPIAAPVDGWAQGFVLPAGGGKLSISRNDLAREASLLAELIAVLAVCMLALPGKRADPAEQAEAMAALRAARDARRASGGSRWFARRGDGAGGSDVVGVGVADDELAAVDAATGEAAPAGTTGRRGRIRRPGAALAGLGSTGLAMTRRRGGRRKADGQDDDYSGDDIGREPADQDAHGQDAHGQDAFGQVAFGPDRRGQDAFGQDSFARDRRGQDAFGQGDLPETVPAAEWPVGATAAGAGLAGSGGQNFAGDGAEQQAPWDMVGDWGSAGRRDHAGEQWDRTAPWADRQTAAGPQAMPTRPPGRPSGGGPAEAAPWETESWGSGPQAFPPATGPQRSPRWQTGPQAPPSGTGPRPAMTPPDAGQLSAPTGWSRETGEWERAARADRAARPDQAGRADWGDRADWADRADQAGRADRAEESGRLGEPGYPFEDDFPAGPADGSGPWPAASAVPGPPSAAGAGKPERHSHRASKHGRPSRWRGSSDRPGRDGES